MASPSHFIIIASYVHLTGHRGPLVCLSTPQFRPLSPPYPNARLLPNFLPLVVNTRHNKFSMKLNINCSFCTPVIPNRVHDISVHRMCELTKRILKMIYYDNQTSVLDISNCLGVSYETALQKCSVFVVRWNRVEGNYALGLFKKKV